MEPILYWIEEIRIPRLFWFSKKGYFINSNFIKMGPYETKEEVEKYLKMLNNVCR